MSSHHFVKEGQEPAVLIAEPVQRKLVEPLLEWAPLVITFEHLVDEVLQWGIKIDVVVGTFDAGKVLQEKLLSQSPVKILLTDQPGDLSTVIYFLTGIKHTGVTILVKDATPFFEKLDNFIGKLGITLLTSQIKWSAIASGAYKKWLPQGVTFLVNGTTTYPLSDNLEKVDNYYEVTNDGIIEVVSEKPFWIGLTF